MAGGLEVKEGHVGYAFGQEPRPKPGRCHGRGGKQTGKAVGKSAALVTAPAWEGQEGASQARVAGMGGRAGLERGPSLAPWSPSLPPTFFPPSLG